MADRPLAGLRTPLRAHGRWTNAHPLPIAQDGLTWIPPRRRVTLPKQAPQTAASIARVSRQDKGRQWRICSTAAESVDAVVKRLEERGGETRHLQCKREEIEGEIEVVKNAGKETGKDTVVKELLAGDFVEVCATEFRTLTLDNKSTLGKMSFNKWQPSEEETLIVQGGVNVRGDAGGSREYRTEIPFKLVKSGLKGRNVVAGSYDLDEDDPSKIFIQFSEMRMHPDLTEPSDIEAWKAELGPHNPTMGDDGTVAVAFDAFPRTWLKFVYMDKDLQCFETESGTFRMLKRVR